MLLHKILVLIAYAQKPPVNATSDVYSESRVLMFSLSLPLHPYFVYTINEGSGKSVHLHRLV